MNWRSSPDCRWTSLIGGFTFEQYCYLAIDKEDDWDTHMGPYRGTYVYSLLYIEERVDIGSPAEMHTCTGACTHSNHGVGSEER